ncbi:MAG: NTP transferase domain-containing protein [Fimbriimonadaceae bacterium]
MKWGVVILAGGLTPDPLASQIGTPRKALAQIEGRTCLAWTLDAVAGAEIGEIVVVGGEDIKEHVHIGIWVDEQAGHIDNARAGVAALPDCDAFLFLPCDTPFLQSSGVRHYVDAVSARVDSQQERFYSAGICPLSEFDALFPNWEDPYLKLKDGDYRSGAYYATSRAGFEHASKIFEEFSASRKNQGKMLMRLGLWTLVRYLLHLITITEAEKRASKLFEGQAILISDCDPYAMADLDNINDLECLLKYAPKILGSQS